VFALNVLRVTYYMTSFIVHAAAIGKMSANDKILFGMPGKIITTQISIIRMICEWISQLDTTNCQELAQEGAMKNSYRSCGSRSD